MTASPPLLSSYSLHTTAFHSPRVNQYPNQFYRDAEDSGDPARRDERYRLADSWRSFESSLSREMYVPPYREVPFAQASSFDNTYVKSLVGSGASLMPFEEKLELMKSSAKRTNDTEIQYQYAIFLISEIKELQLRQTTARGPKAESLRRALIKDAKHALAKLSERGNSSAQYILADGFASGFFASDLRPDHKRAFSLFVAAAKRGHVESSYRAALCYEHGWGCRNDVPKAVSYYQTAASRDHPGATTRLGKACLNEDLGLVGRYREGVRWLRRASENADHHHNEGPYELGCLHEHGYGDDIFQDNRYAAELFTKAADLGHVLAAFRLGQAYENGSMGVPKDAAVSVHFYNLAALSGHAQAQMALCAWYTCGAPPVLDKDDNEAYEWARFAADQGLAEAEFAVGLFSEKGVGCRQDPLEANRWYAAAAQHGNLNAIKRLKMIADAASGHGAAADQSLDVPRAQSVAAPVARVLRAGALTKERPNSAGHHEEKECVIM